MLPVVEIVNHKKLYFLQQLVDFFKKKYGFLLFLES